MGSTLLRRSSRRTFLKAACAGALAYPLLWRYQRSALAAPAPKRLVVFWTPQGTVQDKFWPTGGERDFTLSPILAPLEKHREDLIVLKGFADYQFHPTDDPCHTLDGSHGFGTMCRLTSRCAAQPDGDWGGGISIDQEIAGAVGKDTLRASLALTGAVNTGNHRGFVSYAGAGAPIVPEGDPQKMYEYLFGAAVGEGSDGSLALRAQRRSALDVLRADIGQIRGRLPTAERPKMDAHLEAVRTLERAMDHAALCAAPAITFPEAMPLFPTRHQLHFKTIAAALACDLTRVVTLMASDGGGDNAGSLAYFDGWQTNYHDTGHLANGAIDDPGGLQQGARQVQTLIETYYAQQLADFVDELKSIPEGDGTLFDSTLIYWCNEMGHGGHDAWDVPHVLIGGGWHFDTGRFLQLPNPGGAGVGPNRFGDILISLANAMGHPITTFGQPDWCEGPLELLVNG
jgi:hypothetical protein